MAILAADIGGTYSRFAVFDNELDGVRLRKSQWFLTESANSFDKLTQQLKKSEIGNWLTDCTAIAIAVPGPVRNGSAPILPNMSWAIDISQLHECFPVTPTENIFLINDFVAHALACRLPMMANPICIQGGDPEPSGVVSVIGAGTGLGCCSLIPADNHNQLILPSEAGHVIFPFQSGSERHYEAFLIKQTGRATIDGNMVVSGYGLQLLHKFVTGEDLSPQEVAEQLTPECEVCQRFATLYGRVARNYSLSVLPTGGLYVTGGLAARNHFLVDNDAFRNEFLASTAHRELLRTFPIYLNVDVESGFWGAACYAVMMCEKRRQAAGMPSDFPIASDTA